MRGRRPVSDRARGSREAWYYTRRLTALKSGAGRPPRALPNRRLSKQIKGSLNDAAKNRPAAPVIIARPDHNVSRANISKNALKVLYRLKDAGFKAFIVGGGVRDLLLGREPKDFDVATDAHPDDVRSLFRNCRLIGRRFRLAHVHFGREIIEVATFRGVPGAEDNDSDRDTLVAESGPLRLYRRSQEIDSR